MGKHHLDAEQQAQLNREALLAGLPAVGSCEACDHVIFEDEPLAIDHVSESVVCWRCSGDGFDPEGVTLENVHEMGRHYTDWLKGELEFAREARAEDRSAEVGQ